MILENQVLEIKKKPFGYTNNPKYFDKSTNELDRNNNNKRSSFKSKNKFKKRNRPKNFSFKKYKKKH